MSEIFSDIRHSVIIGGGASGLMCAGSYRAPKLLLEHNAQTGAKLAVSGGGKCNFTQLRLREQDYLCAEKHFCHNALAAFKPSDFVRLLQQAAIPFNETEPGRLFARSAEEVAEFLRRRARKNNTEISTSVQVLSLKKERDLFCIQTSRGKIFSRYAVLASGGLSYPQLGASGFAYQTARALGLKVTELRPALAGFCAPEPLRGVCRALAGNSLEAEVSVGKRTEKGALLFTHEGISGPAVLQASLYWREGEKIRLNFLPGNDAEALLRTHKNESLSFSRILAPFLSCKIAKIWLNELDVRAADATNASLRAAAQKLNRFEFVPVQTGGFSRAEATAGGIDVSQIRPATMECKSIPGLFIIGEALDVTGRVGGYNLHWAWASAAAAAKELDKR